ncbi:MAG: TetR/AcrR family transcriptional regulator [Gammaproteobacteria bacterium]|nr:TetR/AcrR family transcriptional regulator [Gammaproteobacteria bacterium]
MGVAERKRREFVRREAEILQASLALFDGDEWESVTVDQIATRAEIGKGTVYKHFASKHEIYARLALDFYEDLLAELHRDDVQADPVGALRHSIGVAFGYHLVRPEYRRVTQYCARDDFRRRSSAEVGAAFDDLDQRFLEFMAQRLAPGIEAGVFSDRPPWQLTLGLRATFDGAIALLWGGCVASPNDAEHMTRVFTDYMVAGVMSHQSESVAQCPDAVAATLTSRAAAASES